MLTEGTAIPAGDGTDDQEKRKPAASGSTRLQRYIAEPSPTTTEASPAPTTTYAGQTYAPRTVPDAPAVGQLFEYAGQTYGTPASAAAPAPTEAPAEAITTQQEEQKAKTYRARRSQEMSWDDYLELSGRERSAVDFNTMLIQARQKDLRKQDDYAPNDAQREVYDKAVERMFGETGVSETFAPETVALLNDIDFQQTDAKRFDDLDDFLGLKSALTAKDLDKLGKLKPKPLDDSTELFGVLEVPIPQMPEQNVQTQLAAGTNALQESLTRGNQVLENWKQVAAGDRNETLAFYGGMENRLPVPDLRLGQKDEGYFQAAYDALADATNGPEILELIKKDLGSEQRVKEFLRFADTKSQYSLDNNAGLGGDPLVQYRSPDEFREILGLNKGGDENAAG